MTCPALNLPRLTTLWNLVNAQVYLVRNKKERKLYVMKVIKLKGIPRKERCVMERYMHHLFPICQSHASHSQATNHAAPPSSSPSPSPHQRGLPQ